MELFCLVGSRWWLLRETKDLLRPACSNPVPLTILLTEIHRKIALKQEKVKDYLRANAKQNYIGKTNVDASFSSFFNPLLK